MVQSESSVSYNLIWNRNGSRRSERISPWVEKAWNMKIHCECELGQIFGRMKEHHGRSETIFLNNVTLFVYGSYLLVWIRPLPLRTYSKMDLNSVVFTLLRFYVSNSWSSWDFLFIGKIYTLILPNAKYLF